MRYVKKVHDIKYNIGDEKLPRIRIPSKVPEVPVYHYEARYFKRQNRGLFGGLQRATGNSCSEAKNKTLKPILPNIQRNKLWSETLNKQISTKITTKVLKIITKEGGIDNYLTKNSQQRIKTIGKFGWNLRYQVLKKQNQSYINGKLIHYTDSVNNHFICNKDKLLSLLYPYVNKDSYYGVSEKDFEFQYHPLKYDQLAELLKKYNHDLSDITINESSPADNSVDSIQA